MTAQMPRGAAPMTKRPTDIELAQLLCDADAFLSLVACRYGHTAENPIPSWVREQMSEISGRCRNAYRTETGPDRVPRIVGLTGDKADDATHAPPPTGWRAEVERVRGTYKKPLDGSGMGAAWYVCNDVIDALDSLDEHSASTWTDRLDRAAMGIDEYWKVNGWPITPTHGPGQRALLETILRAAFPEAAPPKGA